MIFSHPKPLPAALEAEAREIRQLLAELSNSYRAAAKPYVDRLVSLESMREHVLVQPAVPASCQAGRDGDCIAPQCPQLRDGEPKASGRHCPLDKE